MKTTQEFLSNFPVCSPQELQIAEAQEVAAAVDGRRRYFRLVECRRQLPRQPKPETNASPILVCHSLEEAEVLAKAPALAKAPNAPSSEPNAAPDNASSSGNDESDDEAALPLVEAVIFEVEAEVPQFPAHPIRSVELMAALFFASSQDGHMNLTLTLALREDFPLVPHLYSQNFGFARSLCLWEEPPLEIRLSWTAARYLERLREWLRLSARNELHALGQPLYPLLYPAQNYLVAPQSAWEGDASQAALGGVLVSAGNTHTFVVRSLDPGRRASFVVHALQGDPVLHGVIAHAPETLEELDDLVARAGISLFDALKEQMEVWRTQPLVHGARMLWVLQVPHQRDAASAPERLDIHAFASDLSVQQTAEKLGLWAKSPPSQISGATTWTPTIAPSESLYHVQATEIGLEALNVAPMLSRQTAALFNGHGSAQTPRVVALGAGALGSQIFFNLVRAGWGEWTVVDRDIQLPHNSARHALFGATVGHPKAHAVGATANDLFDESFKVRSIVGDVLEGTPEVQGAIKEADVVFDFSASVPVARLLSHDDTTPARRVSAFLNPSGTQLVILAEDVARGVTLADLEMQFWAAVVEDESWGNYFEGDVPPVRYGRSCGDKSTQMSQELVAMHAAMASRALRGITNEAPARILRWRFDEEAEGLSRSERPVEHLVTWECGEWTVRASAGVLRALSEMRAARLPRETGGVLLGCFDRGRKIVYLVAALPAPPDSDEQPESFVRGSADLRDQVEAVNRKTQRQVEYVGEWHSHPPSQPVEPSQRDFQLFRFLAEERLADGLPPLMLIVGDDGQTACFVETMPEPQNPATLVLIIVPGESP